VVGRKAARGAVQLVPRFRSRGSCPRRRASGATFGNSAWASCLQHPPPAAAAAAEAEQAEKVPAHALCPRVLPSQRNLFFLRWLQTPTGFLSRKQAVEAAQRAREAVAAVAAVEAAAVEAGRRASCSPPSPSARPHRAPQRRWAAA
jgi:hypothetical protein